MLTVARQGYPKRVLESNDIRVDRNGRIWTSTAEGVHCYESDGSLIGKILIPEMVANVTFGGAKLNRLFICGTTSLYSIYVTANGSKLG